MRWSDIQFCTRNSLAGHILPSLGFPSIEPTLQEGELLYCKIIFLCASVLVKPKGNRLFGRVGCLKVSYLFWLQCNVSWSTEGIDIIILYLFEANRWLDRDIKMADIQILLMNR